MSGRASSWWLFLLAAAFFGFFGIRMKLVAAIGHACAPGALVMTR